MLAFEQLTQEQVPHTDALSCTAQEAATLKMRKSALAASRFLVSLGCTLVALQYMSTNKTSFEVAKQNTKYVDTTRVKSFKTNADRGPEDIQFHDIEFMNLEKLQTMEGCSAYSGLGNKALGITPMGRLLRKLGWDEIPQLLNPVDGMQAIGARPFKIEDFTKLSEVFTARLLPPEMAVIYPEIYSSTPKGVLNPHARTSKLNNSITYWPDKIMQESAYGLFLPEVPALPIAVAMTSVDSMLGRGRSGLSGAHVVRYAFESDLSFADAHEMMNEYVDVPPETVISKWEAGRPIEVSYASSN